MNPKIFTDEQDSILRQNYPTRGAPWCMAEIGEKTGSWFSYGQVRSRIKRLGLTLADGVKISPKPHRPFWENWPDMPYMVGPNPNIVGKYLVISYLGYGRRDRRTSKGYHTYRVKCLSCGREYERQQTSITRAAEQGARGCAACSKGNYTRVSNTREEQKEAQELRSRDEWLWVLKTMPPTPVKFVPERMRFDGRR